ncbi:MAG TPA: hypothetical protein VFB72_01040 [Verrucomicrobiae bacterium]|nr:hypothetical protein [Verrucomicrobiae bacterium]
MKRTTTTISAMMLMAFSLWAGDPAQIAKERAKQQRDINNQQQGVTPPQNSPPPSASAPSSSAPQGGISAAQQALIDRLQTDFNSIKPGSASSVGQKLHLQDDIASLDKSAYKPSKTTLAKLSEHLTAALAESPVSYRDLGQIARDINVILNSANLSMVQSEHFVSDTQLRLKNSGVSPATVQLIANDLGAVIVEIQRSKPKLFQ